ncbi:MAG TPA: hypothetical protein VEN81_06605 [Planctomycetota bacterium]|nr:hypothetical protein [Planctomycetota bacterium]
MIQVLLALALQQYDHGNPSADEQFVLEMINRARANPGTEQARLLSIYGPSGTGLLPSGWTLSEGISPAPPNPVPAQPPLAFNKDLIASARGHTQDMWTRDYFDHFYPPGTMPPTSTSDPQGRMIAAGYVFTPAWRYGENIASADPSSAGGLEDLLMMDQGEPGRGHRVNLLDIGSSTPFCEIGIGYSDFGGDETNVFRCTITQDFAQSTGSGPYLVGVVYWDQNGNGAYDQGEGLGGVTITVSGITNYAVTSSSGGYAIPIPSSGTVTVTATGLNLPGVLNQTGVVLSGQNVKVDFKITAAGTNGLPNYWTANYPTASNPAADTDGDTFTNLQEFYGGSDPTSAASTPVSLPPSNPPSSPPGSSGSSGTKGKSGCGSTGLEGAILLWLARALRPRPRTRPRVRTL